jgi:hypothetical protein
MSPLQRLDTRYGVALRADCLARDTFVPHRVTNIGRGGLFLEGTSLPVDSELELRLHLDEHEVLPLRARVVWNHELTKGTPRFVRGMGMKFVGLDGEELRRLEGYLKKLGAQARPEPTTQH